MEYNFQYLVDLYHGSDESYELKKIMHNVDKAVDKRDQGHETMLFHLVAMIYGLIFISGMSVYLYKILV